MNGQLAAMKIINDIGRMQSLALELRLAGRKLALVPTMGALHGGHQRLVEKANEAGDIVIVSIFVNPTQFAPGEDFRTYPRSFETDCELARKWGADIVFAPLADDIYPGGFQTAVAVKDFEQAMCGTHRPGHFGGVATIVLKLLNICQPHVALFGWKDAQQFLLLRRMTGDLNVPTQLLGIETVREPDGLALSSRNRNLTEEERAAAPAIYQALGEAKRSVESGERSAKTLLDDVHRAIEGASPLLDIQYVELISMDRLEPLENIVTDNSLLAAAVHLGKTRLIDNIRF